MPAGKVTSCKRVSDRLAKQRVRKRLMQIARDARLRNERRLERKKRDANERRRIEKRCNAPKRIPRDRTWDAKKCLLLPKAHNRATTSDICDPTGIEQCHGTCYFVAVMVLITKLKMLHGLLKEDTQRYADSIKTCPRINRNVCQLAPQAVRKLYFDFYKRRVATKESNEEVGATAFEGGFDDLLLKAILIDSKVPFVWSDRLTSTRHFSSVVRRFMEETLAMMTKKDAAEIRGEAFLNDEKVASFTFLNFTVLPVRDGNFALLVAQLRDLVRRHTGIVGGLFTLTGSSDHKKKATSVHSVAFSVCGGQINMCNWGTCGDPMTLGSGSWGQHDDDDKLSHVYNVTRVTLVVHTPLVVDQHTKPRKPLAPKAAPKAPKAKPHKATQSPRAVRAKPATSRSFAARLASLNADLTRHPPKMMPKPQPAKTPKQEHLQRPRATMNLFRW